MGRPVRLFHYHLVTSRVKLVEARYLGRLGFDLVARYGWIGEGTHWFEPGKSWDDLEAMGFRLRLIELARGAVNVVLQPGHWEVPRVDHLGIALDEEGYEEIVDRASDAGLKIQDHPGKRTFIATQAGLRVEVHPPRDWIDEALEQEGELRLAELHLRAENPGAKARALAEVLGLEPLGPELVIGESLVRFEPGGPEGRPELVGEVLE
jgi:hypothetical protein